MRIRPRTIINLAIIASMNTFNGCLLHGGMPRMTTRTRYTVTVKDRETQKPMTNVLVSTCFATIGGWDGEYNHDDIVEKRTDKNGRCSFSGSLTSVSDSGSAVMNLPGYYNSKIIPRYNGQTPQPFSYLKPYNQQLTIYMDRIGTPIPLYVKKVVLTHKGDIEDWYGKEREFSFDFVEGDWLPPLGNGKIADVTFVRRPRIDLGMGENGGGYRDKIYMDEFDAIFPGKGNGIIQGLVHEGEGGIRIRTAPLAGYKNTTKVLDGYKYDLQHTSSCDPKNNNEVFRIRTEYNDKGEIVSAIYGKMYGGFKVNAGYYCQARGMEIFYYLNPTPNDRNLEWDCKTNLCKDTLEIFRSEKLP